MNAPHEKSTAFMIKAIFETLKNDVLPTLDQASWPAGNVRACLQLLTYVEDRVKLEGRAMFVSNAAMRELLKEIAAGSDMPHDDELSAIAKAALETVPVRAAYVDITELTKDNDHYQEAVTALIKRSHARREKFDPALYRNLRGKLSACAAAAAAPEDTFVERAQTMVPI